MNMIIEKLRTAMLMVMGATMAAIFGLFGLFVLGGVFVLGLILIPMGALAYLIAAPQARPAADTVDAGFEARPA